MHKRRTHVGGPITQPGPNAYCLRESHLLLAWKACNDASIDSSPEIQFLLVSLLPSLPNTLSIILIQAVQESVNSSVVSSAIFCVLIVHRAQNNSLVSDEVQSPIFDLMWAVLRYPVTSSLIAYDVLKRYAITCPASAAA